MKSIQNFIILCFITGVLFSSHALAQDSTKTADTKIQHGRNFVDNDGDGYNDNAPDHDGDGIPNGLDPDWQKLKKAKKARSFVDLDGDGINDNLQTDDMENGKNQMQMRGKTGSSVENGGQQRGQQKKKHGKKQ